MVNVYMWSKVMRYVGGGGEGEGGYGVKETGGGTQEECGTCGE